MPTQDQTATAKTETRVEEAATVSPALRDAFRALRDANVTLRSTAAARAMIAFDTIRLPYPRQLEAMLTFLEAQQLGRAMKGSKKNAVCIFAAPHTGKTTVGQQFAAVANEEAAEGTKPVVFISMGSGGGPLQMHRSILRELGEGFPATKDLEIMRDRCCEAMVEAGTELLIIDEAHEGGKGSAFGPSITAELKTLLNWGHVSIVLLGTQKAEALVRKDEEFVMRTMAPCRLGALDWADDEDRELWIEFLTELDAEMQRIGIVGEATGLADEQLALALWQACGGVIGQLMKVVMLALRVAIHDNRNFIAVDDLALAVDEWSVAFGLSDINPLDRLLTGAD
ncbi:TniB family NTP-binding protein [Qipengyuania sediminis]|uniref:TniB family NTP-binding protein n=1 Tax=Qipengyuania sediminis TaxID=1532023 RepID=UPI001405254A|nr:TniB family NTP-binding protein [Qipengyuania sediminis]